MNSKNIPYGRQFIDDNDINEVIKILKSEFLTQGPCVEKFEKAISLKVHSKFALTANSATSALHLSCIALGLKTGDELWTSPVSFVASANCGLYCGATINFVDIDPETGLMSIKDLTRKLEEAYIEKRIPKIVIPVHLSGASCDMEKIYNLSIKYGFKIIEDASHAIGATYKDQMIGSCSFSDITIFSFHPVKIITTGEGGVATTNNLSIFNMLKKLRSHGITKDPKDFEYTYEGSWFYEQQNLGFNYRMNDISAALGISQLKKIDLFIKKRRDNTNFYAHFFEKMPVKILNLHQKDNSSHHLTIFQLEKKFKNFHYFIVEALRNKGIGVQIHYIPIHLQPYYKKLGFSYGDFPNSELYASSSFSVPNFYSIKDSELLKICETIKLLLKEKNII